MSTSSQDRARFSLPLKRTYATPSRCSSCDAELFQVDHSYTLNLESGSGRDPTSLTLPLCGHCHRRRAWDRIGALIGLAFGALAAALSYRTLAGWGLLAAVLGFLILLFGVAVAFSVLWAPLCDRIFGRPRFANVLFSLPRGATQVDFDFHNRAYGERFREANTPSYENEP